MEKYNYMEEVYNDCYNFIAEMFCKQDYEDDQNYEFRLLDDAYLDNSVTGNESGSYFFSAFEAEEAICHNLNLYKEARECFGASGNDFDAEKIDVAIRCYLLPECFHRAYKDFVSTL